MARLADAGRCPNCDALLQYMADCYKCGGTGEIDGEPCDNHSCTHLECRVHGRDCRDRKCIRNGNWGEVVPDGVCNAHCCKGGKVGPFFHTIGVEYAYGHPQRYDGVSEWMCPFCGLREGRWSGKVLKDDECEARFGEGSPVPSA